MTLISENNWFEKILGFKEINFRYTLDEIPASIREKMGEFQTVSIRDLKAQAQAQVQAMDTSAPLVVKYREQWSAESEQEFDTSALQYHAMPGTMFMVASNFNCLEVASERTNPFNGHFITRLMSDSTQGPSASGGAAFGSILRVIANADRPINLLENTPLASSVNNGKLYYKKSTPLPDPDDVMIGLHTNVAASFLRSTECRYNSRANRINQVYTSTCICTDGKPNALSKVLLDAAYEGVYLAAIRTQAPKIYLTLIGGGVFRNSRDLIYRSILRAHQLYSKYLKPGCVVELPVYQSGTVSNLGLDQLRAGGALINRV